MEELRKKVEELEIVANLEGDHKEEQIKILKEIGAKLINEYVIQVGNLRIEPMLVEAYYYHKEKFGDKSVHAAYSDSNASTYKLARERQMNKFGELYVHYGCKDGIDVVLSNGDYYLSILIKNALINGEFKKQCAISETICSNCDKFNEEYCKWCYTDGKFVYTSLEELTDFLVGHMSNENWPPKEARAFFEAQLPGLGYWKQMEK